MSLSTELFLLASLTVTSTSSSLEQGRTALKAFEIDRAIELLEDARVRGPWQRDDHGAVYEQLGIAYAYAGRRDEARAAFEMMLAIDPLRALPYTLSPKATLVFDAARLEAQKRSPPTIDVAWPRDRRVDQSIPVDIDVIADPKDFFATATVYWRVSGAERFEAVEIALNDPSGRHRAVVPPVALGAQAPTSAQIYLVVRDERRNEVLVWASPDEPRDILLRFEPPTEWYEHWWVWTIAGAVAVAGTSGAVYLATREPSANVEAEARWGQP